MNKQAIIIIAHGNLEVLNKLLELLDSKYFDIYLHIDLKSDINETDLYKCNVSKLYYYKKNDVGWGAYSMIETEVFLLDEAHKNNYEYYHIISGVDLPIKSNKEIYYTFHNNYPKEFIHFEDPTIVLENRIDRIKYYYTGNNVLYFDTPFLDKQKKDGVNRVLNDNHTFRSGANWVSITHNLVEYILTQKDYIEDRFSFSRCADEMFVQTIVYNSQFINNVYQDEHESNYNACLREIDWSRGGPYIWRNEDFDFLISSNKVFARKFDSNEDSTIVNRIYEYVKELNKTDN